MSSDDSGDSYNESDSENEVELSSPISQPKKRELPERLKKIFITKDGCDFSEDTKIVTFPRSRHIKSNFMITNNKVYEIQKVSRAKGSWFKSNNEVLSQGFLYITNEIDVLFIMLPLLIKHRTETNEGKGNFICLEEFLSYDRAYPYSFLHGYEGLSNSLSLICDKKETSGQTFYRLSDERVMKWLICKVENLASFLFENQSMVTKQARASNYKPVARSKSQPSSIGKKESENNENNNENKTEKKEEFVVPKSEMTEVAIEIISEYVSEFHKDKLLEHYNLKLKFFMSQFEANNARYTPQSTNKKEAEKKKVTKQRSNNKLKNVSKKGMKPITSFFSSNKKPKTDDGASSQEVSTAPNSQASQSEDK